MKSRNLLRGRSGKVVFDLKTLCNGVSGLICFQKLLDTQDLEVVLFGSNSASDSK